MDAFREHPLGAEANEYVADVLEHGHSLSRHLRRSRDLRAGRVVARLAPGAITDELMKFRWGGKYYPEHAFWGRTDKVDDLASYILGYLKDDEGRVCVFENYLARRTDPWLKRAESRVLFFGDEVYHAVSAEEADSGSAKAAIREADYFPVFVGVLSRGPEGWRPSPERGELAAGELRALAENAEEIVVSAYDGEGYLLWRSRGTRAPTSMSEEGLRGFGVAEANGLGRLLVSLEVSSEEQAGTFAHALLDVYESVQEVYGSLVPRLLDDHGASRESVRELLWDVREEFRHIDYHIHDAELTDL